MQCCMPAHHPPRLTTGTAFCCCCCRRLREASEREAEIRAAQADINEARAQLTARSAEVRGLLCKREVVRIFSFVVVRWMHLLESH